ncbi:MAG: hypothetical protein KTR31_36950 [Myxococcales bacterium]|nr:hypothetical protein [Myxococcales bacterium]
MRTAIILATCGALASSCVIYRDVYTVTETVPCDDCTDELDETEQPGEPQEHPDLFLSINEGEPGGNLLTTLEAETVRNFEEVVQISFERDIEVADQILREDELVLLLDIASEALAGPVEVVVDVQSGQRWLLREPFQIVPASTTPTATGDTGAP